MTSRDECEQLQRALRNYARDHGLVAADALVLLSATDADLARLTQGLQELVNSEGRSVGIGEGKALQIARKVGLLLHAESAVPYQHINYYDASAEEHQAQAKARRRLLPEHEQECNGAMLDELPRGR